MSKPLCVVIGAGPGVGIHVARRFGQEGFALALLARDAGRVDALAQGLVDEGMTARAFAADAAKPESLRNALEQAQAELGAPAVVVYNAAVGKPGLPSNIPVQRLIEEFTVNVAGALVAAKHAIPSMKDAGKGTLLFTGGGLALEPWPEMASLAVGKAGIRNLAFSLAKELAPAGIHVATVTINGLVKPGTDFDPAKIADVYWELHQQGSGQWERERVIG